jgi:hemerythrin-like domain-containing protein
MLTATYALLTLSVEQKKERNFISRILHYLQINADQPEAMDPVRLQSQLEELTRFAESRHKRKVERCVIPAVRKATNEAHWLLDELESLSRVGSSMLRFVRRGLRRTISSSQTQLREVCRTMQRYCLNLLERLAKEEQHLLPLAQRVISHEEWFSIGTKFMTDDAKHEWRLQQERRAAGTCKDAQFGASWHS